MKDCLACNGNSPIDFERRKRPCLASTTARAQCLSALNRLFLTSSNNRRIFDRGGRGHDELGSLAGPSCFERFASSRADEQRACNLKVSRTVFVRYVTGLLRAESALDKMASPLPVPPSFEGDAPSFQLD